MRKIEQVELFVDELLPCNKLVVITGAGVSTLSGIPDFRGEKGLYNKNINAEEILSKEYLEKHPKEFWKFIKDNLINLKSKPNEIHKILKKLEEQNIMTQLITQNIDGLDKQVGINNLIELHGNINEFYCTNCNKQYTTKKILEKEELPLCDDCKNLIRPNIVLYNDPIEIYKCWQTQEAIQKCNSLLVLGSTLKVNPISSYLKNYIANNHQLYIANKGKTDFDGFKKTIKYEGEIQEFCKCLEKKLKK